MGTEILKSVGTLQSELEQARTNLKGVDENIKRLIGRDPADFLSRPPPKRGRENEDRARPARTVVRSRIFPAEDEPPAKRRSGVSVFKRLSDRPVHQRTEFSSNKQMISKVIVTPKEVPSRKEALAAQNTDERSKARNKRMFGALLGTLQKFQQEETKLKQREDKRAQLEKKIEEHEIKEKEEIKKERQELFFNRKKKQAEIKMIELKMMRMKEYAAWEERQKPRIHFIRTKAKPHINYLPRRLNDASRALLEESKAEVQKMIDSKKQEVCDELQRIEERMKRNFEEKLMRKDSTDKHDEHDDEDNDEDDHFDDKHEEKDTSQNENVKENSPKNDDDKPESDKIEKKEENEDSKMEKENNSENNEGAKTSENQPKTLEVNGNGNASVLSWGDVEWGNGESSDNQVNTNNTESSENTNQTAADMVPEITENV